jgi:hypothetical protein
MKTLIRARSLAVVLAAMLGGLLSVKPAQAARFVRFGIFLNGQYILVAGTFDNGYTDKDGQWDYLKRLPLTAPRGLDFVELMPSAERDKFLHMPSAERPKYLRDDLARRAAGLRPQNDPFVIKPDADHPLQATLEGKITVIGRYSYTREVSSLRLDRKSETESRWRIAPEEVDRMRNLQPKDVPQR